MLSRVTGLKTRRVESRKFTKMCPQIMSNILCLKGEIHGASLHGTKCGGFDGVVIEHLFRRVTDPVKTQGKPGLSLSMRWPTARLGTPVNSREFTVKLVKLTYQSLSVEFGTGSISMALGGHYMGLACIQYSITAVLTIF